MKARTGAVIAGMSGRCKQSRHHATTQSNHHKITQSRHHATASSRNQVITPSRNQAVTPSRHHTTTQARRHSVTQSCSNAIKPSHHRTIMEALKHGSAERRRGGEARVQAAELRSKLATSEAQLLATDCEAGPQVHSQFQYARQLICVRRNNLDVAGGVCILVQREYPRNQDQRRIQVSNARKFFNMAIRESNYLD